jgi:hypothetical protein
VPVAGSYRFVVSCQRAGTAVQLRFDHLPDALLLATTGADGEQPGAAADLAPGTTYHLTMEATGTADGVVEVLVLGENLPQGPLDRLVCHAAESVERVRRANVLLDKALRIAAAAGLTEPELRHVLTHPADFGGLALTALPATADEDDAAAATVLFGQVGRLLDYATLRAAIAAVPGELTDLFAHARQTYPADPAAADQAGRPPRIPCSRTYRRGPPRSPAATSRSSLRRSACSASPPPSPRPSPAAAPYSRPPFRR